MENPSGILLASLSTISKNLKYHVKYHLKLNSVTLIVFFFVSSATFSRFYSHLLHHCGFIPFVLRGSFKNSIPVSGKHAKYYQRTLTSRNQYKKKLLMILNNSFVNDFRLIVFLSKSAQPKSKGSLEL